MKNNCNIFTTTTTTALLISTCIVIISLLLLMTTNSVHSQVQPDTEISWQICPEITPTSSNNDQNTGISPSLQSTTSTRDKPASSLWSQFVNTVKNSLPRRLFRSSRQEESAQFTNEWKSMREQSKRLTPMNVPHLMRRQPQDRDNINIQSESTLNQVTYVVECALVGVPLIYNSTTDDTKIQYFVKRWRIPNRTPKGQLWLLQGGPGSSGKVFDGVAGAFQQYLNNEYDVYAPDFRGTGRSTFMACGFGDNNGSGLDSNNVPIVQRCYDTLREEFGDDVLWGFGTTQAVHDIMTVQRLVKQSSDEKLAIYGVSYGTYLLNRLLQLYPNEADTTIFDSVVQVNMSFTDRDDQFNEAGESYIDVCRNSSECNGRFMSEFGKGVDSVLIDVFQRQNSSDACMGSVYRPDVITRFNAIVLANKDLRRLVFPIIFRLNRCDSSEDIPWLTNVARLVRQVDGGATVASSLSKMDIDGPANDNNNVFINIVTGELTTYPIERNVSYWIQKYSEQPPYFWADFSASFTESALILEPVRYNDSLSHKYATEHTKPVLTMQGTLDPQTPFSFVLDWNMNYNRSNNYFVKFPNAVHATAFSTPTSTETQYINTYCGSVVMLEFIKDNTKVYTACVSKTEDYNFNFNSLPNSVSTVTRGLPLWDDSDTSEQSQASQLIGGVAVSIFLKTVVLSVISLCIIIN